MLIHQKEHHNKQCKSDAGFTMQDGKKWQIQVKYLISDYLLGILLHFKSLKPLFKYLFSVAVWRTAGLLTCHF